MRIPHEQARDKTGRDVPRNLPATVSRGVARRTTCESRNASTKFKYKYRQSSSTSDLRSSTFDGIGSYFAYVASGARMFGGSGVLSPNRPGRPAGSLASFWRLGCAVRDSEHCRDQSRVLQAPGDSKPSWAHVSLTAAAGAYAPRAAAYNTCSLSLSTEGNPCYWTWLD
eukprot:5936994-Pleurochrysis_carterae.AAC.2